MSKNYPNKSIHYYRKYNGNDDYYNTNLLNIAMLFESCKNVYFFLAKGKRQKAKSQKIDFYSWSIFWWDISQIENKVKSSELFMYASHQNESNFRIYL